jgi:hypothetical protein
MSRVASLLVLAALGSDLAAQNYRYSPSNALTTASSGNTIPWNSSAQRYQQVHGDLRTGPMLVQEISFRRGNSTSAHVGALARTLDAEVFVGNGDYATSTTTFATNYLAPPVNVITRKSINLPDLTAFAGNPAPFTIVLPFDNPHVYTGSNDLVWEIVIWSNTASGAYFTDAMNYTNFATTATVGVACTATGQTNPMLMQAFPRSVPGPTPMVDATWRIFYGPVASTGIIFLGAAGTNLPIPGLCTNLYVDRFFHTFVGPTTGASGVFNAGFLVPFDKGLIGIVVHAQGFAVDSGHPGLGLAATQGVSATIVDIPSVGPVRRIYGGPTAPTGTTDTSLMPLPYGLVTRFRS